MSEDEKQLTVRMPKSLHKQLKLLCTEEDVVINNAAVEAIEDWIVKRKAAIEARAKSETTSTGGSAS